MKIVNKVLCALFVAVGLASANAQTNSTFEAWNLTIAGGGSTTISKTESSFAAEVGLSKEGKFILPLEVGARQSIGYISSGDRVAFTTQPFADVRLLKLGNASVYVGANATATYGNTPLTWTAGPEGVLKFDLTKDAYFFGRVSYNFALNGRSDFQDNSRDDITYRVGVGIRF